MRKIRVLTVPQTRDLLDVSDKTVYRMISDGRLESYRKGDKRGYPHAVTLESVVRNLKG
jgi:excisionase family DNA binding protein